MGTEEATHPLCNESMAMSQAPWNMIASAASISMSVRTAATRQARGDNTKESKSMLRWSPLIRAMTAPKKTIQMRRNREISSYHPREISRK